MMTESRRRLADQQAELVRALVAKGPIPAGFDAKRIQACARSLVNKRRQALARAWPKLVKLLGERYVAHFTAYAGAHPLPGTGSPLADGRAFLDWLDQQGELTDALQVEAMAFDMHYIETPIGVRSRHGFAFKTTKLRQDRARIIAVRIPWLGERWWRIPRATKS